MQHATMTPIVGAFLLSLLCACHALESTAGAVDKADLLSRVERLEAWVHSGDYESVREVVRLSHEAGEELTTKVASRVRQAVQVEKNKLDDLIRALDRNYGKAAEVNPAAQWAQNSTHIFLSVKFAQRWNAPGALEVENETISFTPCCFNFTAFGEHSMIRRRYHLSWHLFLDIAPERSTWAWASAGRMTVIMPKASAGKWPRLLKVSSAAPKNLGVWQDMKDRWESDLARHAKESRSADKEKEKEKDKDKEPSGSKATKTKTEPDKKPTKKKTKTSKKRRASEDDDEDEALSAEVELLHDCPKSTYVGTSVVEICGQVFKEVVQEPKVKNRRWLIEFYSSQGDGDRESMKGLMPIWRRLADTFPAMVHGGKVGAVDCGLEKELCNSLGIVVPLLPSVYRFADGKSKQWKGTLSASPEDYGSFGAKSDSDEL